MITFSADDENTIALASREKALFVTDDSVLRALARTKDVESASCADLSKRLQAEPRPAPGANPVDLNQIRALGGMASETMDRFSAWAFFWMTPERAAAIRALRIASHTWRAVAEKTAQAWELQGDAAVWLPLSNQLAGMALCKAAARLLGEDYRTKPWN